MHKSLILAAIAALAFTSIAEAKACKDPATHKFIKCTAAAATPAKPMPMVPAKSMAMGPAKVETGGAPHCVKGKPCGHSCIAMDKVCHK